MKKYYYFMWINDNKVRIYTHDEKGNEVECGEFESMADALEKLGITMSDLAW